MMIFDIPKDNGIDWRWHKFKEYYKYDPDPNMNVLEKYCDDLKMTESDRLWLALIYSACYCVPTTLFIHSKLPSIEIIKRKDVEAFWATYKAPLIFQTDRKYVKNMNWFGYIIEDFVRHTHRQPSNWLNAYRFKDKYIAYNKLYKEVISWRYFGRVSTVLFLEAVDGLTDLKLDANWFDWKNGQTATEGMFHLLYMDEEAEKFKKYTNLSPDMISLLNKEMNTIRISLDTNIMSLESGLCSFRKLFKQTRYGGYYSDRLQIETNKLRKDLKGEFDGISNYIWDARSKLFAPEWLGEVGGWNGYRTELLSQWVEKGLSGVEAVSEYSWL